MLQKWEKPTSSSNIIADFNGCDFVIRLRVSEISYMNKDYHYLFAHAFAKFYNATVVFDFINVISRRKINESLVPDLEVNTVDLENSIKPNISHQLTVVFDDDVFTFTIPQPEFYSPLEKVFLPFDTYTWILFLAVNTFAAVVVGVLSFAPKQVREFCYGRGVNTPIFNMVKIFFGIGQTVLPGRNFARFILVLYIFFCLIFRTVYQGKHYEFLFKVMN